MSLFVSKATDLGVDEESLPAVVAHMIVTKGTYRMVLLGCCEEENVQSAKMFRSLIPASTSARSLLDRAHRG